MLDRNKGSWFPYLKDMNKIPEGIDSRIKMNCTGARVENFEWIS